ncbi:MAG: hypothetical protein AB1798_21065 [Spirochaetota bacterium]
MISKKFIIVFSAFFSVASLYAIEVSSIDIHMGLNWLGNSEQEGGPSPLLPASGISVPLRLTSFFFIDPEFLFFGTQYRLMSTGIKAVPTEIEFADSVWYLNFILDIAACFEVKLSNAISLGASLSPAFDFRIPFTAWGEGASHKSQMTSYFYGSGRFFYPAAGLFFNWNMFQNMALMIRFKVYFPMAKLWTKENTPFHDQLMLSGTVGLRFLLKPQKR